MNALVRSLRNLFGLSKQHIPSGTSVVEEALQVVPLSVSPRTPPQMASLSAKAAVMIKPHIPMIRFRYAKGLGNSLKSPAGSPQRPSSTEVSPSRAGSSSKGPSQTLDDLPARYRRRQMSQEEMDSINTGGVAAETVKPAIGKPKSR